MSAAEPIVLTADHIAILRAIVASEYHDGNHPVDNPVWTFSCHPSGMNRHAFAALLRRLEQFHLVTLGEHEPGQETVSLTESGWLNLQEHTT